MTVRRAGCCVLLTLTACTPAPNDSLSGTPDSPDKPQQVVFRAGAPGLVFHHSNGASGEHYFPEIMGAGVAVLDYDGDGDLDVFAVQGQMLGDATQPLFALPESHKPGHRLFRNDIIPSGELRFVDVSEDVGLGAESYGMGVATGDYDNDGDPDIYVTNVGANILYRNDGDAGLTEVTRQADVGDEGWSVSATFFDYDRDGDLDLFVVNYVRFFLSNNIACKGRAGQRDYCDPTVYPPARDKLYRNEGDGRFEDVTESAGLGVAFGNGLGVTATDVDSDGWPDVYVANDKMANQLWMNLGDGRFEDRALSGGTAYNADGAAEASMGVAAGDYDGDGDDDLFLTHLSSQTNTLYRNEGREMFVDVTESSGLALVSLGATGFGTEWFDVDNDGDLDLFSANGAVQIETAQMGVEPYPYLQTNQLFVNNGSGRFDEVNAGSAMGERAVGRGAAFGDIDNDGDVDVVVSNNNGPLRLLVNQIGHQQHWLTLQLRGTTGHPDALGARVIIRQDGRAPQWRRTHTDGSYASASDVRLQVGLGAVTTPADVEVIWPDGQRERWAGLAADALHELVQGSGQRL